jgi:hypothetical protein
VTASLLQAWLAVTAAADRLLLLLLLSLSAVRALLLP